MGRYKKPFTIYKRGLYWYYRTYTPDGYRTTPKTTGCTTKTAAMNYCNELFKNNLLGVSDLTFKEYSEHFFDDNSPFIKDREKPLSFSSVRQHRQYLKIHIAPAFDTKKLHQITFSELKSFRQSLLDKGLKANTINGIFQTFHAILKFAYMDNKIQKDPLQGFGSLARPNNKDGFKRNEIIEVYKNLPDQIKDFFLLSAITGMRTSECFGITEEDLKCEDGMHYIHLTKQLTPLGYYTDLKTKECRDIPIAESCVYLVHKPATDINWIKNHSRSTIRNCENWKERKLSLYSTRHFFITDSKAKGVDNLIVETIAGHSLKGMQAVYTNFHIEDLQSITQWQNDLIEEIKKTMN